MDPSKEKFLLDQIKCPTCGDLIPVNETLHHQLIEAARKELKEENVVQQKRVMAKETELKEKEKALLIAEKNVDLLVESRLKQEKDRLQSDAVLRVREESALQIKDMSAQLAEKDQKLRMAQTAELDIRKQKRDLEEKAKSFELELARKLDEERSLIQEEAVRNVLAEHSLKDAEKEKKLQDAIKANDELRRKLQQGSQQTQGEVLELELEELLKSAFPHDDIVPVTKGIKGADLLQKVYSPNGQPCGVIVWESKHTKAWSESWISKLKDDQREMKADVAVLVTEVLPKETNRFGFRNNIWITKMDTVHGLATAIRITLIQVTVSKLLSVGKNEKMEVLFQYLSGVEFKQKVEAIVEAFVAMQEDLNEEKRFFAKRWAKREKQLERVIANTVGMYGNLQGLMGASMQAIPELEMKNEPDSEPRLVLNDQNDDDLFDA
ncbi:MAG: DUF2130 domain-containing protein [Nitrospirae bacterium]|nr:DUF2130 domain-containing protein [Nitrospirota bacterium]MBI3595336.1 DUF2130 domain-containing protein [Nitrospirota bacterium]